MKRVPPHSKIVQLIFTIAMFYYLYNKFITQPNLITIRHQV